MSEVTIAQKGTLETGQRYAVLAVDGAIDAGSFHDLRQAFIELLALQTHVALNCRRCRSISPALGAAFKQLVLAFPRRGLSICLVSPAKKFLEILGDPEVSLYEVKETIIDAIEALGGLRDASDDTLRVLKADVNMAIDQIIAQERLSRPEGEGSRIDANAAAANDVDRAVDALKTVVMEARANPKAPEQDERITTTFLFFADWIRKDRERVAAAEALGESMRAPADGEVEEPGDDWIMHIGEQ